MLAGGLAAKTWIKLLSPLVIAFKMCVLSNEASRGVFQDLGSLNRPVIL